jgi:hypothetical protein
MIFWNAGGRNAKSGMVHTEFPDMKHISSKSVSAVFVIRRVACEFWQDRESWSFVTAVESWRSLGVYHLSLSLSSTCFSPSASPKSFCKNLFIIEFFAYRSIALHRSYSSAALRHRCCVVVANLCTSTMTSHQASSIILPSSALQPSSTIASPPRNNVLIDVVVS